MIQTASLGNFVFEDSNANGIQDAGEAGIAGAQVTLLADTDNDGQIDDVVDTATTADDGSYQFTGLTPGVEYKVTFTQPDGFDSVSPFQAGDDATVDSDANPENGLMSEVVVLASGENNPTIDAGFFNTVGLGDFVFEDSNGNGIQDAGEEGVENVLVKLQNPDGTAVLDDAGNPITTTTGANGEYSFTGLIPGEYQVMFVAPEGFEFTTPNAGDDDTVDSDANPEDGTTQTVVLESGDFNGTLDAGLIELNPGIDIEKLTNGIDADTPDAAAEIIAGETVTWTYIVTNTGDVAFDESEIVVTDDQEGFITNIIDQGDGDATLASGEIWVYQQTGIAQDLFTVTNTVIDFETDGFGNALSAGTIIDTEYQNLGLTIAASQFGAMIFDSANPTGGDHDLETPGYGLNNTTALGNILIISEDGDSSDPDDNAHGGKIAFSFDNAVNVNSIDFLDIEEAGGRVFTTDVDGNVTTTYISNPGDNSFDRLIINDDNVVEIVVHLVGSGAITALDFDSISDGIYKNVGTVVAGDVTDDDHSHYINPAPEPGIDIEKFVNGIDASGPDEYPELVPGDHVTFTYHVTNTGNVAFAASDVIVTDDNGTADDFSDDFNPYQVLDGKFNVGDINQNNILDADETWKYAQTLTVQDLSTSETIRIEAEDFHLYNYGVEHNSDASGGELIALYAHDGRASTRFHGETGQYDVVVGYFDENDGHARAKFKLNGHTIDHWTFDEHLGSYLPNAHTATSRTVAEHITIENGDTLTLRGFEDGYEFARFDYIELIKKGDADGIYENVATVEAGGVFDSDISGYTNSIPEPENPGIDIEKFVNGIDASGPDEYPELVPGDHVTFTYHVTNTGNVAFAADDVIVTDDNGTADDIYDDFNPYQVLDGHFNVGDVDQNNILDAGEIWKYAQTLTVQDLSTSETTRIEAEDMHLSMVSGGDDDDDDDDDDGYSNGYVREHNDYASGGDLIKVQGHYGTASTKFYGEDGNYDVLIGYYDENDGHATMDFKLNGHSVDHWTFNKDLGSYLPNDHTFTTRTVEHIHLEYGDTLSFKGTVDGYEYARIDYIELIKKGDSDGIYENVATVEAGDVFDTDISGYINPVNTVV